MEPGSESMMLPSGRDVLVVEDELRIRNMLSQALKQMNFQATLVQSAEAALRLLAQRKFDILMLDLNLPGMSGMEFLESIRKQQNDIQVIVLTGFGDLEAAKRAIHLDVVEFLTKPCTLGNLEIALDRARKRRKGQIVDEMSAAKDSPRQFDSAPKKPRQIPAPPADAGDAQTPTSLEELEKQQILNVLKKHGGNRAAMAAELGISVRKLYYRLSEYQKQGLIP